MNSRFDPDQAAYYQVDNGRGAGFDRESEPDFFFYDLETLARGKIGLCNLRDSAQISTWNQLANP